MEVTDKKDYVNICPGPKFRVPWMDWCPLNRGVLKKRFHCIILHLSVQLRTNTYKTELLLIFLPGVMKTGLANIL